MTRLLRFAFWAAFVFAFVMAVLPQPPRVPGDPPDKILHIIAFAVLAALASAAYRRMSKLALFAGLALLGAVIELVQTIPSLHRDGDVGDWIADIVAAGLVLGLAALIERVQRVAR